MPTSCRNLLGSGIGSRTPRRPTAAGARHWIRSCFTHEAGSCIPIGECWIEGLPATLPKSSPVQVRCGVASNGLIDVLALDMTSGRMARTMIQRSSGLSEEEVAREAEFVRSLRIQ